MRVLKSFPLLTAAFMCHQVRVRVRVRVRPLPRLLCPLPPLAFSAPARSSAPTSSSGCPTTLTTPFSLPLSLPLIDQNIPALFHDLRRSKYVIADETSPGGGYHSKFDTKQTKFNFACTGAMILNLVVCLVTAEFGYLIFGEKTTANFLEDFAPSGIITGLRCAYVLGAPTHLSALAEMVPPLFLTPPMQSCLRHCVLWQCSAPATRSKPTAAER